MNIKNILASGMLLTSVQASVEAHKGDCNHVIHVEGEYISMKGRDEVIAIMEAQGSHQCHRLAVSMDRTKGYFECSGTQHNTASDCESRLNQAAQALKASTKGFRAGYIKDITATLRRILDL